MTKMRFSRDIFISLVEMTFGGTMLEGLLASWVLVFFLIIAITKLVQLVQWL